MGSVNEQQIPMDPEPIAIIGSGCRFAGGITSPSKLWELLSNPRDVLSNIPKSRFNPHGFFQGKDVVDKAYLLSEDCSLFDHGFFGIRAKEAEAIDPQHRMLLEVVYEGIESAGYSIQQLQRSSTAVYVGQINTDYYDILSRDLDDAPEHMATGTARSIASNRVSYFFDWTGPSVTIDTACSSSLVAVQQALKTLRDGDSSMAVAAGVNLLLGPEQFVFESKLGMLSPRGRCSMWSASADGYARGEGIAAVILKTLSRAIADGDSIECVIREVKVNQDGHTMGITMPNSASQTSLIRATYESCGLDPTSKEDRCQFFEAHGTGTPAGDPVEARAVQSAFFPNEDVEDQGSLIVGSVKTLLGHTEGTAGLAGLLKASLAVQHGIIPANLHMDSLSPAVRPYCKHLTVPTSSLRWPELPANTPRRVSVNSFGFGGTNSHAIIESWQDPRRDESAKLKTLKPALPYGPAVVSASSASSLMAAVSEMLKFVQQSDDAQLADILWTLQTRRSEHRLKAAFPALDREMLIQRLSDWITMRKHSPIVTPVPILAPSPPAPMPGIFAVFTGQGAQWPEMGMKLLEKSQIFRDTFRSLEDSLAKLPDPPSWSLREQLGLQAGASLIHQADIGQPLCTAVQIALVDLLNASGVKIDKIVGHSSGEIAAAYAAGYLTSSDAIRISYYRGLCAGLAKSVTNPGGMLAADLSLGDATALCKEPRFHGRLTVAASNSPTSVTLSGDVDAVEDAVRLLDAERGVFARRLKVDTAYHSHHMEACASQYRDLLKRCDIKVKLPGSGVICKWYSSVHPGREIVIETLADTYWVDNLVKPVLFAPALEAAFSDDRRLQRKELVVGLEIGPHPALKKPVLDTLDRLGMRVSYSGVFRRGANDMEVFTESLGFLWEHFLPATNIVDFDGFRRACVGTDSHEKRSTSPKLCKDLPAYCWDHSTSLWRESRMSQTLRQREAPHPLLGHRRDLHASIGANELHWRNIMRLEEVSWLSGHQFQGQALFPAAGYISMAVDACIALTSTQRPWLLDLEDCVFHKPLILEDDSARVVLSTLRVLENAGKYLTAEFSCGESETNNATARGHEDVLPNFTCKIRLEIESNRATDAAALPSRARHQHSFSPVDTSRLYDSVAAAGLQYTGEFRAEGLEKGAEGVSVVRFNRSRTTQIHLHPAILDKASHGILWVLPAPTKDDEAPEIYLPSSMERVRVDMRRLLQFDVTQADANEENLDLNAMVADCYLRESGRQISCDLEIFSAVDDHPEVHVEGLICSRFGTSGTSAQDRMLFSHTVWRRDLAHGIDAVNCRDVERLEESQHVSTTELANRAAHFYLKRFRDDLASCTGSTYATTLDPEFQYWVEWASSTELDLIESDESGTLSFEEWPNDTHDAVLELQASHPESADLKAIVTIGETLPELLRGHTTVSQLLTESSLKSWTDLTRDISLSNAQNLLSAAISQAVHRYPHMNIIEIGTGADLSTAKILETLTTSSSASVTVTGDSEQALEEARRHIGSNPKAVVRTLDVGSDCLSQGFKAGEYDMMVFAFDAFSTPTTTLDAVLLNCRRLLRPGGYALLISARQRNDLHAKFISTFTQQRSETLRLPGQIDTVPPAQWQWHRALLRAGFSGIDSGSQDLEANNDHHNYSIMVTQAIDENVSMLRDPLAHSPLVTALGPKLPSIAIIGARSLPISKAADSLGDLLRPFSPNVTVFDSFDEVPDTFEQETCAICLSELHEPIMKSMTRTQYQRLQNILCRATHVLWLTTGRRDSDPYANMVLGIARSVMSESPGRPMLFVDTEKPVPDSRWLATAFLRMVLLNHSGFKQSGLLWSNETELAIDSTGCELYPRIIPTSALNNRLNAQNTQEARLVSPEHIPLCIEPADGNMSHAILQKAELLPAEVPLNTTGAVNLITSYSTVYPLTTYDEAACLFLSTGVDHISGRQALFLSPDRCSHVAVAPENTWFVEPRSDQQLAALLQDLEREIVVESLAMNAHGRIWVHGAGATFVEKLSAAAKRAGTDVFFSTSETTSVAPGVSFIHPQSTRRRLQDISKQGFGTFANLCGSGSGDHKPLDTLIRKVLGSAARIFELPKLDEHERSVIPLRFNISHLRQIIGRYVSQESEQRHAGNAVDVRVLPIAAVSATSGPLKLFDVLDWADPTPAPVILTPLNPSALFSANKTYVLAGLTGDLGLSLCEWMVASGARHVVLGSRSPNVSEEAIRQLEAKGATIKVLHLDLGKRKSVEAVGLAIKKLGMPPVGGVANGAMVMREKVFEEMSMEEFVDVLAPKVQGTINLDRVFGHDLDFFILLSSASSVNGVPGLANYGAANTFMHAFTQQRRRRGLASSVLDISVLAEHGYVARSAAKHTATEMTRRYNALPLSDADFFNMFAEAIYAGCRYLEDDAQITTGIDFWRISSGDVDSARQELMPPWYDHPRLSHLVRFTSSDTTSAGTANGVSKPAQIDIREQLASSADLHEALMTLTAHVVVKLERLLQTPTGTVSPQLPLIKLGADSLVASQLRSWITSELGVKLPALKILSSPSMEALCEEVLAQMPDLPCMEAPQTNSVDINLTATSAGIVPSPSLVTDLVVTSSTSASSLTPTESQADSSKDSSLIDVMQHSCIDLSKQTDDIDRENGSKLARVTFVREGPLSHGQSRLYLVHSYLEDKSTHNCGIVGKVHGPLSMDRLRDSLERVAEKHESLRSCFLMDDSEGEGRQAVMESANLVIEHKHLTHEDAQGAKAKLMDDFMGQEFDIERGQCLGVLVISSSATEHDIMIVYHHLIMDGISLVVVLGELEAAYSGRPLGTVPVQAIELSNMRRDACTKVTLQREMRHWSQVYPEPPPVLPLFPFAKRRYRAPLEVYHSHSFEVKLDASFAHRIRSTSSQLGATTFHFLTAVLGACLSQWLGVSDISIGIVDANRQGLVGDEDEVDDYGTVGYFLNLLGLRLRIDPDAPFYDLVAQTRDKAFAALENSTTPFQTVLDKLHIPRNAAHHPLFQVAINHRVGHSSAQSKLGPDCIVEWDKAIVARNPFDMHLDVIELREGGLWISLFLQSCLYTEQDAKTLTKSFVQALEHLGSNNMTVRDCPIASKEDKQRAVQLGRGPLMPLDPWPATLAHRVDEMAALYPSHTAIKDADGALTYSDTVRRSVQIAECLQQHGVTPGSSVAVCQSPTAQSICSMLGIMRIGAVYVPLDTLHPTERLGLMVADSKPLVILARGDLMDTATRLCAQANENCVAINLDDLPWPQPTEMASPSPQQVVAQADQPACTLFTSGSTGQPKGVVLTHRNLINQIRVIGETMGVGQREVVLQQSSLGFDPSLEQIFGGLAHGGTVVVVPETARRDPVAIAEIMAKEGVTYTVAVPSEYASLLRYGGPILARCKDTWRLAVSGGERLGAPLLAEFGRLDVPSLQLVNAYGPTECTVSCTRGFIDYRSTAEDAHLGCALPNYVVMIVDPHTLKCVPQGFAGEIVVGGEGVAAGYLNRPLETKTRFVPSSAFSEGLDLPNTTFYRTGDSGRMMEDGTLRYLGRIEGDTQVKLRGVRVELGEVAGVIASSGGQAISEVALSLRDGGVLVAFVVFSRHFGGDKQNFLDQLMGRLALPVSMRPAHMVPIDRMPMTQNGKRDQRAIDSLPIQHLSAQSDQDSKNGNGDAGDLDLTPMEQTVKGAWEEVLTDDGGIIKGRETDFFGVGGNSLLLLRLQSVLTATFGVRLLLPQLFQSSRLGEMTQRINAQLEKDQGSNALSATMDWHREIAALADGLRPFSARPLTDKTNSLKKASNGLSVLLTGATGFVGTSILQLLVDDKRVRNVHCVAIRPDSEGRPRMINRVRGPESVKSKIIEYPGDLADRYLGLTHADFSKLTSTVDVIIHNGADVSLLKTYASLRRPNVLSSRTLLEMALGAAQAEAGQGSPNIRRNVPIHFVSTASVVCFAQRSRPPAQDEESIEHLLDIALGPVSVSSSPPAPEDAVVQGYRSSKWASEALLERAVAENPAANLRVVVHRPTSILGPGASENDALGSIVRVSTRLGAAPRLDATVDGVLDLVDVEDVARGVVDDALASVELSGVERFGRGAGIGAGQTASSSSTIRFAHHCSPQKMHMAHLGRYLSERLGCHIEECDQAEWLERAKDENMGSLMRSFLGEWETRDVNKIIFPIVKS